MSVEIAQPGADSPARKIVLSKDGTLIAFERAGQGPALILVDGALCHRGMGPSKPLAELLARDFTVFTYDRRGRGESSDTAPYAMEREIEDLATLIKEAGGSAFVWGMSSGAVLALEAATHLRGIEKLALYEAPLILDDSRATTEEDWRRIREAVVQCRPGDAVKAFLKSVGVPGFFIGLMRFMPVWSKLEAVAHTLPYDGAIVGAYQMGKPLPAGKWASLKVPTLVIDGGKSPEWMRVGSETLAAALPTASHRTLVGQTHQVDAKALAPALVEFFVAVGSRMAS